jgi:hypothetical protein
VISDENEGKTAENRASAVSRNVTAYAKGMAVGLDKVSHIRSMLSKFPEP